MQEGEHRTVMQIEYSKKSVKYIASADKQTKKRLKEAIEKIPLGDIKNYKAWKMVTGFVSEI